MSMQKMLAVAIIAVIISGLGYVLLIAMPFIRSTTAVERDMERARMRLLCETDHQALLGACRAILRQVADGKLKTGVYVDEEIAQFPDPIHSLRPNHVTIGEGKLKIEMMYVGWSELGVYAYCEGYRYSPPLSKYGDRKLLDGLWYYEAD
jgi:hypothetical protein